MKYKKIPPAFGYFGSKNRLAKKICDNLPEHTTWIDAFCGSAAITLAKPPSKIEIINDIHPEIYNVIYQIKNNHNELNRLISLTPYAMVELDMARITDDSDSNLERSRKFMVQSIMSVNGVFGKSKGGFSYSNAYSRGGVEARVSRWLGIPNRVKKVAERLKHVELKNADALSLIEQHYMNENSLIYLDPPYLCDRALGYDYEANDLGFHTKLLNLISDARCMIFISGYSSHLYESMLTEIGWCKRSLSAETRSTNGKPNKRTEILWMNNQFISKRKI